MEEINLKELFNYFVSKTAIIVLVTLLCFSVGCFYTAFVQKPKYKSYTTIILTKEENNTSLSINDINLNKSLVDTYRELIKSKKIAKQVIKSLNLKYSDSEFIKLISVESVNDTNMIKITVVSDDPNESKLIANEIANVFNDEVVNYFDISNLGIVDTADADATPYNVNVPKQLVLGLLVGFVLSFGIVFVMFYFDNTIKSGEEIENKVGLSVIGYIPMTGGK